MNPAAALLVDFAPAERTDSHAQRMDHLERLSKALIQGFIGSI
jgi:hypothetical protein